MVLGTLVSQGISGVLSSVRDSNLGEGSSVRGMMVRPRERDLRVMEFYVS